MVRIQEVLQGDQTNQYCCKFFYQLVGTYFPKIIDLVKFIKTGGRIIILYNHSGTSRIRKLGNIITKHFIRKRLIYLT